MSTRLLTAVAFVLATAGQTIAQDKAKDSEPREKVSTKVEVKRPASVAGIVHRASEIAGMSVRNPQGKELGTIKDTVIDVKAGQVKYAALSYGGFLGLGDKLFAVPWDALEHHQDIANDKHYFVLNVDEETLKRAPGFDSDKWPNFADQQFSGGIDKYYDKFRTKRILAVEIPEGKVRVDVDVKRDPATARPSDQSSLVQDNVHRASKINGMTVKNAAGKQLGAVNDMVIEVTSGKVRYAALSYGGFLGLGDKLFAVPWSAFEFRFDPSKKDYHLVLDLDEVTLRKATGFNKDNWPNFADPKISEEIDQHYHRKAG
jgi:sporulation protein YlmC with PRC-barrel domain